MKNPLEGKPLRKKAEKTLPKKRKAAQKISPVGTEKLIHELEVHQVELEMQNEELRKTQEEVEASRSRYVDIYDFAPVGYFTLNEKGVILEANLTGAKLLETERKRLLKVPFSHFIMPEDQDRFRECQRKVFQIPGKQSCEVRLKRKKSNPTWVGLESVAVEGPDGKFKEVRLALSDITERKRAEEEVLRLNEELEAKVRERTAQLEAANKALREEIAGREQAEQEIRQSEREFRGIFEFSSVGMIERDASTGQRLHVNPRLCEMTGYSAKELLSQKDIILTHPDDWERDREVKKGVLKGKSTNWANEKRYVRKDGEVIWVQINGRLIRDSSGEPYRTVAVIHDITERKRAEEALRESEAKTNALIRYAPTAVYELNYEGTRFISVNDAMCRILGYTREELLLMNPSALLDENSRALFADRIRRQLSGQKIEEEVEYRVRKKDGSFIDAILYVSLAPGAGKSGHTMVIAHDITERKLAEKKLNDSERLYRAIGESIDYGIWVCDPEGRNTYASESFLNLVGFTQDQCSEFGWGDVLHPEDAERTVAAWKECVRTGGKWDIEHRYRGADGKWHSILARGVPVRDEQGKVICWAGINLDISGLKQMEEDLRRSRDELEKRVQERTEELAKSHSRLQNLSSQLLLAQEKERKRVAVELHDGLLSELAGVKYMLEARTMLLEQGKIPDLSDLKRVSHILAIVIKEARGIMNNLHPSVLDELGLIAALKWLSGEYQKSYPHIEVKKRLEIIEQDVTESLKVVIYRVLQEALNNFAKHGKGDRVGLSLSKSNNTLTLTIQDNGQGFDVKAAQKGLGLESMRERVELSGGDFHLESTIGQGTVIRAIWKPS